MGFNFNIFKKVKSENSKGDSDIKNEVNGLVILSIGFLWFLAILSYDQRDITFTFTAPDEPNLHSVRNWLGIIGSTAAKYPFEYTFGYATLVLPVLIMLFGIFMIIDDYQKRKELRHFALLGIGWAYWGSIALVMFKVLGNYSTGKITKYYPSGAAGGFTAQFIADYLGRFALIFISCVFLLILLMISFRIKFSVVPLYIIKQIKNTVAMVQKAFDDLLHSPKKKKVKKAEAAATEEAEAEPEAATEPETNGEAVAEAEPEVVQNKKKKKKRKSLRERLLGVPPEELYELPPAPETAESNGEPEADAVWTFPEYVDEDELEPAAEAPLPEDATDSFAETGFNEDVEYNETAEPAAPIEPIIIPKPVSDTGTEIIMPEQPPQPETVVEVSAPVNAAPAAKENEQLDLLEDEDLSVPEVPKENDIDYDKAVREAMEKYTMPPLEILHENESDNKVSREELMANADLLENTLAQFNVKAFVKKVIEGPVITLYAVRPAEGVKISQVVNLSDDLALAMRAKGIRMIAPIPGEAAIGIEIPNRRPSVVYFKSVVKSEKFSQHSGQLSIGMGKTIGGEVFCADLSRMPHLLIAGATGAGKSVGINTIISSILYRVPPSDVKFVMIDPKKLELSLYAKLKDHYLAICPDIDEIVITHPQNAVLVLRSVVNEMEERYDTLAKVGVRDIISYNKKIDKFEANGEKTKEMRKLPYIVVIIDELADLILTASREVEEPITRLAQMARAVGIHLIVATQRPSVDILTGLIKANFPTRIAYQVATRPDSKVILDMYGAEKLIGNGDMLFLPPGTGKPVRLQNPYISTEEVESLIQHIKKQPKFPPYTLKLLRDAGPIGKDAEKKIQQDDLFEKAKELVIRHQQGSVSLLQRKLKIGYARAGRLMDSLEEAGIVGPGQGSKAREVLVSGYGDE